MNQKKFLAGGVCLLALCMTACGKEQQTGQLNNYPLDGTWIGIGHAIGYDEDYSIENITLSISKDGVMTFDDGDQDTNDLIAAITVDDDTTLQLICNEDPSSYTLPTGWKELNQEDEISYELLSDSSLVLTCNKIPYFFTREDKMITSASPLYELGENNVWYSNDGSKDNERTYELDLFNEYAELYTVSPNNAKALVTNFFYLSNEGDNFTFFTNIRQEKDLPDILKDAPGKLNTIDLTIKYEDETLTMAYKDKPLVFHNNVIYGLKTDGDSYKLCDKAFKIIDGTETYYHYFAMNPEKETLYLYISDAEEGTEGANTICGEIKMNEKKKKWTFYFDKKASAQTAAKDSDIYLKYSGLNGSTVKYKLDGSLLHMETIGNIYDLMLTDRKTTKE